MRLSWHVPASVLAMLLAPALAQAAWLPGGNRIGNGTGYSRGFVATASGPDRVVVAWVQPVVPGRFEIRVQAWTAEGSLATGWPDAGVLVRDLAGESASLAIAEDAAGGAFIAWTKSDGSESSVLLQHVSAAGSFAAGWTPEGLRLGGTVPYWPTPVFTPDGTGGMLMGRLEVDNTNDFRVIIQRIDAGGGPTPGWPVEGLAIPNAYGVGLAVDAQRHVFVSTTEYDPVARTPLGMRIRRLDGNGAPDPAWPQEGALLTHLKYASEMTLFPDGAGGVLAGWHEAFFCVGLHCPPPTTSLPARILGDGSLDPRWSPRAAYSLAPDETGGMLLSREVGGRPGALRVDASGAVMPGWAAGGNAAMTEVVDPWGVLVTGDGHGGAFVAWQDRRSGENRLYASRLDAAGRLASGWPATGSFIDAGRAWITNFSIVSLGDDVAVALWEEWTPSGVTGYLTALRPGEPGPVAELGPVQAEVGFGIVQAAPNPAQGPIVATVELRDAGPARLDLVDAAGRVLETREYSFPSQARGAVRFNQTRAIPPGVYWLRLAQGGRKATRKVVVLE